MHPLRLATAAKRFGCSGRTLLRLFKRELDTTFGAYFRVARMTKAIELLTNSHASVTEVALAAGYNNLSSFSSVFQESLLG